MISSDPSGLRTYDARFAWLYANPFAFTGQRCDAAVGTYHFLCRTYLPWLGRWGQRDPLGYVDGVSLYEYVNGDPLGGLDTWGLADWHNGCNRTKIEDWIAEHILRRLMTDEYLQDMPDRDMYIIGIGVPAVAVPVAWFAPEYIPSIIRATDWQGHPLPSPDWPKPPGWTPDWTWEPSNRGGEDGWRWWDPDGGEWWWDRDPNKNHPEFPDGHWDHWAHDHPSSGKERIPPADPWPQE